SSTPRVALISYFVCCTAPSISFIYTLSLHDALPICYGEVFLALFDTFFLICTCNRMLETCWVCRITCNRYIYFFFVHDRYTFTRSEEHTSELQSRFDLVCRLLLEKKKISISKFIILY